MYYPSYQHHHTKQIHEFTTLDLSQCIYPHNNNTILLTYQMDMIQIVYVKWRYKHVNNGSHLLQIFVLFNHIPHTLIPIVHGLNTLWKVPVQMRLVHNDFSWVQVIQIYFWFLSFYVYTWLTLDFPMKEQYWLTKQYVSILAS